MMLDKLKTMLFNNNVETLDNLEGVKLDILSGLEIIMEGLQDVHNAIYLFDLPEFDYDNGSDVSPSPEEKASFIFSDKDEDPYDLPF